MRKVWKGWTLVDRNGICVDPTFRDPYVWKLRKDAEECKEEDMEVVRCELRVRTTLGETR